MCPWYNHEQPTTVGFLKGKVKQDHIKSFSEDFTDIVVFDHGYSWEGLRKAGINPDIKPPIPLSIVLDHKYSKEGELERLKVRMAIAGHPGNMQRGVHYDKTPRHVKIQTIFKIF